MEKALADVKVLDLTHVQAGPSCGQMLGFLGADVVKVEDTRGGDSTRVDLAHREDSDSFYFLIFNNNKRAITLDLKTDQGKELFKGLIRWADVLVENFSKGMLDRLGLGWDVLHEINERLVYATIKGFGEYGPDSDFKGYEFVAQAVGGAMATTGAADRPPPMIAPGVGDSGSGLTAAIGILAALHKRERTGKGQKVEISMQDVVVNLMRMRITPTLAHGDERSRNGHMGFRGIPMVFPCAGGGPDDYVLIHPRGDGWDMMLAAIDRADLIGDPRFDDEDERAKNAEEATAAITEWTSKHTKDEAWRIIARGGVLAGATYNTEELLELEHLREREMVVTVDDPVRGDYTMIGMPIKLSDEHTTVTKAPRYGEHNESVLKTILGCSDDDLAEFRANGVIV
ncbi:MAG: formyl-CoA transferase [SAR202 cluster bacterium]|jgi:formyl-CoA transferase|nr:formyl-CoA transferase [Chloroflexota bacterium]MDP6420068.1 CoA transferase [SAR202 cluster bacterium]HAL47564.1 formyl-CoA transferase [Dehalococcoidia bacterium]MDP6664425.1 CoA transferase [SAR202 cluster bacterium]MDP6799993.1 CoA transferase [SAR202 cluster bacterium]|tara:strand:+ start:4010 stop:5206 length:1197 start_codon:yes stop_codon:yes gene_type:complete